MPDDERQVFVTALVRRWITYERQRHRVPRRQANLLGPRQTPLDKPVVPEPALHGWARQLTQEWNISTDDLPGMFDQLNRGQSAKVVNADDIPCGCG